MTLSWQAIAAGVRAEYAGNGTGATGITLAVSRSVAPN